MAEITALKNALMTAKGFGFRVMPVHGNKEFGGCTCGFADCNSVGKHPVPKAWQEKASNDEAEIRSMFAGLSNDFNYGIATGEASNVFVLDVDGDVGRASLAELESQHGKLPVTLQCNTGRGMHLFFKYPSAKVISRSSKIGKNLDIKGSGGQVVGAGSTHISGTKYEWDFPGQSVSDPPEWLVDLACGKIEPDRAPIALNLNQPKPVHSLNLKELPPWSADDVKEMLSYISPDVSYDEWKDIGMAIHSYGLPFSIWDDWSRGGTKYNAHEMPSKWNSFKGSGVTMGTLFYHAEQGGYKPTKPTQYQPERISPNITVKEVLNPITGEITEVKEKTGFFYINAPDIIFEPDTNDFVQGTLTKGAMSVVYGESNCGKTFFMSDMAFHIVQGKEWNGKRVEKGNVLYVCMEGSFGLKNRITAYRREFGVDLNGFLMMPCSVDFTAEEDGDIEELLALLETAKAELGEISLIVIDTLARAIAGGDENSGQDMGVLVRKADVVRAHSGAHICFIHHSGKDKARGARGHSSLRAAVDTEIEISRAEEADYSTVKIAKQRDMEKGEDAYFKLKKVELGENRHGEKVTSCVVEPYDVRNDIEEKVNRRIKSGKTKTGYDAFIECVDVKGAIKNNPALPRVKVIMEDDFIEYLSKRGVLSDNPKSAKIQYNRIRIDLIENDLIIFRDGYLWPKQ